MEREFALGIAVNGAWGLTKSVGELANVYDPVNTGLAWSRLAHGAGGVAATLATGTREQKRLALLGLGKCAVDTELWRTNPPRALGETLFNAATFLGGDGIGAFAKAGEVGSAVGRVGEVGRASEVVGGVRGFLPGESSIPRLTTVGWTGDYGLTLTHVENAAADVALARAAHAEESITPRIQQVVAGQPMSRSRSLP